MIEITREADIRLEVMSYGRSTKEKEKKTDNKQLIWKERKRKNKIKTKNK